MPFLLLFVVSRVTSKGTNGKNPYLTPFLYWALVKLITFPCLNFSKRTTQHFNRLYETLALLSVRDKQFGQYLRFICEVMIVFWVEAGQLLIYYYIFGITFFGIMMIRFCLRSPQFAKYIKIFDGKLGLLTVCFWSAYLYFSTDASLI